MPSEHLINGIGISGISLTTLSEAITAPGTRDAIEHLASESYANAGVLLEQEYAKNNRIYLYHGNDGRLEGFFMVGWSKVEGIDGQTVFLGLSTVSKVSKSKGIGKSLYRSFFNGAKDYVQTTGEKVTWWFHTATPVVSNAIWNMSLGMAPRPDGTFTHDERNLAETIKQHFGMSSYACSSHPFVLRGYAKARYAPEETSRIGSYLNESREDHLLKRLAIDEQNGDRLLCVGRIV